MVYIHVCVCVCIEREQKKETIRLHNRFNYKAILQHFLSPISRTLYKKHKKNVNDLLAIIFQNIDETFTKKVGPDSMRFIFRLNCVRVAVRSYVCMIAVNIKFQ